MVDQVDETFDELWKTESVKIAMSEQLNSTDELDLKNLFRRAVMIYKEGYKQKIHEWNLLIPHYIKVNKARIEQEIKKEEMTQNLLREAPKKEPEKTYVKSNEKICPKCNEAVNKNWKKHSYKKNGERCGFEW